MRILLTGASSFTGYWFARQLADAGHEVAATFTRGGEDDYATERKRRIARLRDDVRPAWNCRFGDDSFLALVREFRPDRLCHHAAEATDYKSSDFDCCWALAQNTYRVREVLDALADVDCNRIILTGSVFEGGEGAGSEGLPHFSPYGLSKALSAAMFRYYTEAAGVSLGKFVIPNPFGPLEEPRFTAYLARSWYAGDTPTVRTPAYVRDNIHVSLLARAYVGFVAGLGNDGVFTKLNPSGYVESQGAFAERFAAAMRPRLKLKCPVAFVDQTEFMEPRIRVNTDPLDAAALGWDESKAWDEIAEFYQSTYCIGCC